MLRVTRLHWQQSFPHNISVCLPNKEWMSKFSVIRHQWWQGWVLSTLLFTNTFKGQSCTLSWLFAGIRIFHLLLLINLHIDKTLSGSSFRLSWKITLSIFCFHSYMGKRIWQKLHNIKYTLSRQCPRGDAGGVSRENVLRIPSVS